LRKVATIIACLVVTTMFAACNKNNPDDDDGNGNGNGNGNEVTDPVSTKALQGAWKATGTTWVFGDNGKFAELEIRSSINFAMNYIIQGEYKVSGRVIKLTKCNISSASAFSSKDWNDIVTGPVENLLKTPLSSPGKFKDFTAEFEFFDASMIRLRLGNHELAEYDIDLKREGNPFIGEVPTHRIPSAKWPANLLSPDMPEYIGDRIREVYQYGIDETGPEYGYVMTVIDRSSSDALLAYITKLRTAGWTGPNNSEILDGINSVNPGSLLNSSYEFQFRKGCYKLFFSVSPGNNFKFEIASKREIEGIWPTALFGNEFRPPSGTVIIGEIKTSEVLKDNGNMFLYCEMDFWPKVPEDYVNELKTKGFENVLSWVEKTMSINGKMYEVRIDVTRQPNTSFAWVTYYIDYKP